MIYFAETCRSVCNLNEGLSFYAVETQYICYKWLLNEPPLF